MPAINIRDTYSDAVVWSGSIREFLRGNGFDRAERREICRGLRANPVRFGGGAAPAFTVTLVSP